MVIISLLLIITSLLILLSLLSTQSYAHGYVESPPARAYIYSSGFPGQTLTWAERYAMVGSATDEPQSLGKHHNSGWPYSPQSPRDGYLASADCVRGCPQIDIQNNTRWTKTSIPTGWNDFTWFYTAWHETASWQFFMTKQGWDPNAPLSRDSFDLEPIYEHAYSGETPDMSNPRTTHPVFIPTDRSGYHVIYAVWTTTPGQNNETFYNVIDVDIVNDGSIPPVIPPVTPPPGESPSITPPTNLRVTGQTESSITLAWNASDNSVHIDRYEIFRDGIQVAEVLSYGSLTYTDTGLMPDTTYNYTVRAHAISGYSNIATGTTKPINGIPPELTPPMNLRVTSTTIYMSWNRPTFAQGLTGYRIYRNNVLIDEVSPQATYFIDLGLTPNTTYTYAIASVDQFGNEARSQTMTASTVTR